MWGYSMIHSHWNIIRKMTKLMYNYSPPVFFMNGIPVFLYSVLLFPCMNSFCHSAHRTVWNAFSLQDRPWVTHTGEPLSQQQPPHASTLTQRDVTCISHIDDGFVVFTMTTAVLKQDIKRFFNLKILCWVFQYREKTINSGCNVLHLYIRVWLLSPCSKAINQ